MSLSIIIPTCGRPTLAATLASAEEQLEPGDEIVLVGDGYQPDAHLLARGNARIRYAEHVTMWSRFGNAQRDYGMRIATGTHVMFIDDDDRHEPGALELVRQAISAQPDRPHIFRATWGLGHHAHGVVLWKEKAVREQNIATPMVVLPNISYSTSWMAGNTTGVVSDFRFLSAAIQQTGEPVWHDEVIATVRP